MGELTEIIKLDATDSTNLYLKDLLLSQELLDYTTVVTKNQRKGRGQLGTIWETEEGKNLTFSVLKNLGSCKVSEQFKLNICVSLAVYDALNQYEVPNIKIKWPNDIMSGSFKICGILIENLLKGQFIKNVIIGIGLNVNQTQFGTLTKASSLSGVMGRQFDLNELLASLRSNLKLRLDAINQKTFQQLQTEYEQLLFRKDKPSTFKNQQEELFMGIIRGISEEGKLIVELEDDSVQKYDLKEVTLQY
ncbi:biotin--[acetyl-CoA-carboxylase] ligase [Flagellimonas allohymeniacidonis]|uniref:Biotin--[acetyl-CoA-carboxylase] ligase n=1 Tax=Flagellimonas allohymeniacidonis TaxID=2517819 RepID=A0A4Q8QCD0_9FLAO|nr:biotin--[acetyl-CoA-carboxylase] ligase [Allomuricauda hymeniacidonis]TAI46748.1 biotin--[acetyl-CoA-carboxylase] ligase [Allomuricauda hymeniacidonis]